MSLANWIPRAKRSEVGKRLAAAKRAKHQALGVDAETLRYRALHDARGEVLREGRTYSAEAVTHWLVRRSINGRTDQRDIVIDGALFRTCGPRRLPAWLR